LHFGLTPDDLLITHPSQQWNPYIARTLFFRGVIEDFGTGFQRMVKTMADYGGSPPQLEESASSIRITIQSITPFVQPPFPALPEMPKQAGSDEVDGADVLGEQIIDVLKRNPGGLPFRNILEKMDGADFERVRYVLSQLKEQGRVTSTGVGAGSKWWIA
jgi:predicted HTH transcriptional regulator